MKELKKIMPKISTKKEFALKNFDILKLKIKELNEKLINMKSKIEETDREKLEFLCNSNNDEIQEKWNVFYYECKLLFYKLNRQIKRFTMKSKKWNEWGEKIITRRISKSNKSIQNLSQFETKLQDLLQEIILLELDANSIKNQELLALDVEEVLQEIPTTSSDFTYAEVIEDFDLKKIELKTKDNLEETLDIWALQETWPDIVSENTVASFLDNDLNEVLNQFIQNNFDNPIIERLWHANEETKSKKYLMEQENWELE